MIRFLPSPRLLLPALLMLPRFAGAWGAGHDDVMRAVLDRLPVEVRATVTREIERRAIEFASHYPDSFEPCQPAEIGEAAVASLKEAGVKVRYDLHLDHGRVASFAALVEAFREGDPAHIAHWIASHSHIIADMAACNHDPLVHTATYGWGPWKVRLPNGSDFSKVAPLLDLAGSARDPAGGTAAFDRAIERSRMKDDGREVRSQVLEILLYGQEGARFCSPRGTDILKGAVTWTDSADESGRALLWDRMGELGAWAVARTLRDVEVARRFAKEGTRIELTEEDRLAAKDAVEKLIRDRPIAEDSVFAPVLRDLAPGDRGRIGVVIEPTWDMNDAMLGFSSRVQAAAMARTLGKQGRAYATIDLRGLLTAGFPDPEEVPLLLVTATSFRSYYWMDSADFDSGLSAYTAKGGNVLWIAGTGMLPEKTFASVRSAWKRTEKTNLPVPAKAFVGSTLTASFDGNPSWTIVNTPDTPAGWQQPFCPWWFDSATAEGLEPILTLSHEGSPLVVGATTTDRRLTILPVYAVTPHLLDATTPVATPHEPELDGPSAAILLGTIDRILK
jgi:hypothetical protein